MIDRAQKIADCSFYDKDNIRGFFGVNRFLSNFEEAPIWYEGFVYGSTEAAYQAAKSLTPFIRAEFTTLAPSAAKRKGNLILIRDDWAEAKDDVMRQVCFFKFTYHKHLQKELLATGDKHLEEANWWGDIYWGTCKDKGVIKDGEITRGIGQNKLGIILMDIRDILKSVEDYKK